MASEAENAILQLLDQRGEGKTICPSEAARLLAASEERAAWEPQMKPVRAAASRLVARDVIEVTQRGRVVELEKARGPMRLRRKKSSV